jgi:hypothetical protein
MRDLSGSQHCEVGNALFSRRLNAHDKISCQNAKASVMFSGLRADLAIGNVGRRRAGCGGRYQVLLL